MGSNKQANAVAESLGYKDAETLKQDVTGSSRTSGFDIYKDTQTGNYYVLQKGGTGEAMEVPNASAPSGPQQ